MQTTSLLWPNHCPKTRPPTSQFAHEGEGFGVNHGDVGPQSILPAFPVSNNIPGVQPNRLENLDDLLAQAEHYANYSMRKIGRLPPTLFLIGSKGPLIYTPESLEDEAEKDDFATTARLSTTLSRAQRVSRAEQALARSSPNQPSRFAGI